MTVSSGSGNSRIDEKPYFRFFPSMTTGSMTKISRYFPRKFTVIFGAASFLALFAFSKLKALRDSIQNQQKKPIEKIPLSQQVQVEIKQPIQSEFKPVATESEIQPITTKNTPIITQNKAARTYAERREQLITHRTILVKKEESNL